MTSRKLTALSVAMLLNCGVWATLAAAQEGNGPLEVKRQNFKLDANDGCFRYVGDAVEFVGRFREGSYVGIAMNTIDDSGLPVATSEEGRSVAFELPEVQTTSAYPWFGPVPKTGEYSIMFSPRAAWGSAAMVTICGRTSAPS